MKTIIAAALVLLAAPVASASVTDADGHPAAGGLPAILDENNNRLWLDISHTGGWSYEDALQSIAPGQPLEGWTIAGIDDVEDLMTSAGITFPPYNTIARIPDVMALINIWGSTRYEVGQNRYWAGFITSTPTLRDGVPGYRSSGYVAYDNDFGYYGLTGSLLDANSSETYGVALYRVPEPTTCTLALAALCLAMSRRRS